MNLKQFYSISEVAEKFGVAESLLRYWEQEFPAVIKPRRAGRGVRQYTLKDIDSVGLVYHLVKEKGLTIDGARSALAHQRGSIDKKREIVEHLKSVRNELQAIGKELASL